MTITTWSLKFNFVIVKSAISLLPAKINVDFMVLFLYIIIIIIDILNSQNWIEFSITAALTLWFLCNMISDEGMAVSDKS